MEYFSINQAAKMLGISRRRLLRWEKIRFLSRSIQNDQGSFYTFQDLVSLKAAAELISGGISLQQVARSLEFIQKRFPEIQSISELKFFTQNHTLMMQYNGLCIHPITGQLSLSYDEESPVQPRQFKSLKTEKTYLHWFERGLRWDVQGKWEMAAQAYRKALKLNPTMADCWNNLATIFYRIGKKKKAIKYYMNALRMNPDYKLGYYNLGNIFEEIKRFRLAIKMYLKAIELDPEYYDAHYNLALVYDKVHSYTEACHHWEIYFQHDSNSRWAQYAQDRIHKIKAQRLKPSKI